MNLLIQVNPHYYMKMADRYKGFFVIKHAEGWHVLSVDLASYRPHEQQHGIYTTKAQALAELDRLIHYWRSNSRTNGREVIN